MPTQAIAIGHDYLKAGFAYNGHVDFNPRIWQCISSRKRRVKESISRNHRWIRLFCYRRNPNSHYFYFEASPNRIRWRRNTRPSIPADADYIIDYIQDFLNLYFPVAEIAPLRSDRWTVTGVDFNLDMNLPSQISASLVRSLSHLPFQRSSVEKSYHHDIPAAWDFEEEEWLEPASGMIVKNSGTRLRYGHACYSKYEEVYERSKQEERKLGIGYCRQTSDVEFPDNETFQDYFRRLKASPRLLAIYCG